MAKIPWFDCIKELTTSSIDIRIDDFCTALEPLNFMYLLKCRKTWNNLKWPETNYTSMNQPETAHIKHERTWNNTTSKIYLNWATSSKKQPERTWNNLEWAINGMKRPIVSEKQPKQPTTSKEQPETTCKEQLLTSWKPSTWKIIHWSAPLSQRNNS